MGSVLRTSRVATEITQTLRVHVIRPFKVDVDVADDEKRVIGSDDSVKQVGQFVKEFLRHVK